MTKPHKTLTLPVVAVDIGHHQTKICAGRQPDGSLLVSHFPSLAPRVDHEYQAGAGPRLRGVQIDLDGSAYFVGADSLNVSRGQTARVIDSNYSLTPEYRALFLGALHHVATGAVSRRTDCAGVDISTLVLGLPMNTLVSHRDGLTTMAQGEHMVPPIGPLADGPMPVRVRRVLVMGQPMGALLSHSRLSPASTNPHRTRMVLDVGGGTVDWFVAHDGLPAMPRSGAYPKGTLAQAFEVCDRVHPEWRDDPFALSQIDTALQTGAANVTIGSTLVDLKAHQVAVDSILRDTLRRVADRARPLSAIGFTLVTGGGARRMFDTLKAQVPDLAGSAHLDQDPVYSNVRGFHQIGEAANHGAV